VIFLILSAVLILSALAVGIVRLFIRWERQGREQLVPLVLLGLLVVEATIYSSPNGIPRGLFHPGSGSTQLRLPDLYITLALIARLAARGVPKRIGLAAGLWLAYGVWLAAGIIEGKLYGNQFSQIIYQGKEILYVVGAYALAAGVPVRKYFDRGDLYKLGTLCVVCATVLDLMTVGHVAINTTLPLLPLQSFGAVGNETAALFLGIVTMCFVSRLASGPVLLRHVLALVPVVGCVVLAEERAVLANMAVVILVLITAILIGHWRGDAGRFVVRLGQVVLVALAAVAAAIALVVLPAAARREPVRLPLASNYENLFHSVGKTESAQDRLNLASSAEALIPHHVFIGYGLGAVFQFYEAGFREVQITPYTHDIALDLLLRLGLVGLLLFAIAFTASIVGGLRVWRRHTDARTAAFALALVAVLAGLLATGFLEPMLDEYRFAVLFGVSLGMLRACVSSIESEPRLPTWRQEAGGAGLPARGSTWAWSKARAAPGADAGDRGVRG
jgi:O-antigen ligase